MSSLQEVRDQAFKLSVSDRLALVNLIVQSLQSEFSQFSQPSQVVQSSQAEDAKAPQVAVSTQLKTKSLSLINKMRGFLKTGAPAPSDAEVQMMLEERLVEKYLQ